MIGVDHPRNDTLQVAYIDTEGVYIYACPFVPERQVFTGTFRPDRIKSIADRFGVNGDMALENILYGTPTTQ
jgi:hypothetical protein